MTGGVVPWLALAALTVFLLWVDLRFFARGREPSFRDGVISSIGWLVVSVLAAWSSYSSTRRAYSASMLTTTSNTPLTRTSSTNSSAAARRSS